MARNGVKFWAIVCAAVPVVAIVAAAFFGVPL